VVHNNQTYPNFHKQYGGHGILKQPNRPLTKQVHFPGQ
jgi:hypothetical protein